MLRRQNHPRCSLPRRVSRRNLRVTLPCVHAYSILKRRVLHVSENFGPRISDGDVTRPSACKISNSFSLQPMFQLLQTGSAGPREHTRMGIARKKVIPVKKTSLPAPSSTSPLATCANAQPAAQKLIGSGQIILRRTFCVLLILQCLAVVTRADISKQEFQKWVDDSTLIFKGTIVALDSNVDSIGSKG